MYVGIPGLCPTRDENSSDDNSDDIMPALLTKRDNAGWDSSDDDSLDDSLDDDEYDLPKSNFADIEIIGNPNQQYSRLRRLVCQNQHQD